MKFAQKHMSADNEKAIATANIRPLKGRNILSVKKASNDSVHNWTRGIDEWILNDNTRKLFKNAIADMFGGEEKIPESVKKAMILDDYNQGKPLTARRIKLVKTAIDLLGGGMFASGASVEKAHSMGYLASEMPKLARVANLYLQATGCSEAEAKEPRSTQARKRVCSSTAEDASRSTPTTSRRDSLSWTSSRGGSAIFKTTTKQGSLIR
ncbi:MAG: hypothetical protein IKR81_04440 [Victivallales bacterium]|nr:hypothetical protein [Victivallales bacterium]